MYAYWIHIGTSEFIICYLSLSLPVYSMQNLVHVCLLER